MKYIFFMLAICSSLLFAGKFEIDVDGQNKLYDTLISIKSENPSYVEKLLNQSNAEGGWETENYKYLYKVKISDGDRIGIFVMSEIKKEDFWLVKQLDMKSGYILLIDGNTESKIVWKGNYQSYDSCEAPLYSNLLSTITPTCKQRWDMYSYFQINKILQTKREIVRAKMDGVEWGHLAVQGVMQVAELYLDPEEKIVGEVSKFALKADMKNSLNAMGSYNDQAINLMADIMVDAVMESLKGTASPLLLIKNQTPKIIGIFNDLFGTLQTDSLIEEMNDLLVSSCYLQKYYEFGGDNGKVALFYGNPYNPSLWDTIDAVAKSSSCGSMSNDWYGTEYHINKIQNIVEDYKYNDILKKTKRCLEGGCS